jgi:hypothetical protein
MALVMLFVEKKYYSLYKDHLYPFQNSQSNGIRQVLQKIPLHLKGPILVCNVPNQLLPTKMHIMYVDYHYAIFYVVSERVDKNGNLSIRFRLYVLTTRSGALGEVLALQSHYRPKFLKILSEARTQCFCYNTNNPTARSVYVKEG